MLAVLLVQALLIEAHPGRHEQGECEEGDPERPGKKILLILFSTCISIFLHIKIIESWTTHAKNNG